MDIYLHEYWTIYSGAQRILFRMQHRNGRININFYTRIIQGLWNSFSLSDGHHSRYSGLVIQRTRKHRLLNRENTFFTRKWTREGRNNQCLAQLRFRNNYIHLFVRFYSILGRFLFFFFFLIKLHRNIIFATSTKYLRFQGKSRRKRKSAKFWTKVRVK